MAGAEVAVADYVPGGWPIGTRCVVRRVRLDAAAISADPRARRRRTIDPDQLALVLDGELDTVYAYSFIATNLALDTPTRAVQVEAWYRQRTNIEDRFRDAKHGAALRHLPSGDPDVNLAWVWGALLTTTLSAWLQELGGLDDGAGRGRAHLGRLRRELTNIPACLVRHGRELIIRPAPTASSPPPWPGSARCPRPPDHPARHRGPDQEPSPGPPPTRTRHPGPRPAR